jgi:hypothetical protein
VRPHLEKPFTKIGLVKNWLKVKALRPSPSTSKKRKSQARKDGRLSMWLNCYKAIWCMGEKVRGANLKRPYKVYILVKAFGYNKKQTLDVLIRKLKY